MLIVSGARRTGTALAIQVLERSGISCFSQESVMDQRLPERNPFGYKDSTSYIKANGRLPSGFDAIKLFSFDFPLLPGFRHSDHQYLITLRHPQYSIASVRVVVGILNANESISKSLRAYIAAYEYLLEHVVRTKCQFAVVDFGDYPNVVERFQAMAPNVSPEIVTSVWSDRSVHFSDDTGAFNKSFADPASILYNDALDVYVHLRQTYVA